MEISKIQESLFILTNKGYLELEGILKIKEEFIRNKMSFDFIVDTEFSSQADFILEGCNHKFIKNNEPFSFKLEEPNKIYKFKACVDGVTEGEYYNTYRLNFIKY
jgi:hypothetical protein